MLLQHLVTSIHAHWSENLALAVPTFFPGAPINTESLTSWFELWVDGWSDPARRLIAPDQLHAAVVVHCFSRHPERKSEVHELADAARQVLSRRTISLFDYEANPPQSVGSLRLLEHTAQDLTRNHAANGQKRLQHVVLIFEARALEWAPAAS